jgi:ubiquitin-protein ligase
VPHAQQIIHPNIYKDGKVCITSLQTAVPDNLRTKDSCPKNLNWNPSIGVAGALLGVISLLSEPNFDDPGREGGGVVLLCSSVVADAVLCVLLFVLLFSQQ